MMRFHSALVKIILVPLSLTALVACSGKSGSGGAAVTLDANGNHPADWVQQHWIAYKQQNGGSRGVSANTGCSDCHGSDLSGGISRVSCFSASLNGISCHANADHTLGHPASWSDPTSSDFHGSATASFNGAMIKGNSALGSSCGVCHATGSNVTQFGSVPSCLSTDPKWGISCHASSPAAASTGCVSCHGTPPAGASAPNRAGAHAAHLSLAGVTCNTCHSGFGTGTSKHANGAFLNHSSAYVRVAVAYAAQTGSLGYTGGRCSAVSCHGGTDTPAWSGGSITVAADCLSCHQLQDPQAPQYNSFYSGNYAGTNLHQYHLAQANRFTGVRVFCTDCHNAAKLPNSAHFAALATSQFEMPASETLGGGSTRINSYDYSNGSCNNSCHAIAPNPAHWNN
jgi:predicted CxxxxCH...CXXCH cytochrome family protein